MNIEEIPWIVALHQTGKDGVDDILANGQSPVGMCLRYMTHPDGPQLKADPLPQDDNERTALIETMRETGKLFTIVCQCWTARAVSGDLRRAREREDRESAVIVRTYHHGEPCVMSWLTLDANGAPNDCWMDTGADAPHIQSIPGIDATKPETFRGN